MASNATQRPSKGIPSFMAIFIIVAGALLLFHLAVLANAGVTGGVAPTLAETTSALISSPTNPVAGFSAGAQVGKMAHVFFALLIGLLVGVLVLLSRLFSSHAKKGKGRTRREQTATAHRTSYAQVKDTLSKKAALESAKVPLRSLLIPPKATKDE